MMLYYHHFTEYYETANIDFLFIWLKEAVILACKLCFV